MKKEIDKYKKIQFVVIMLLCGMISSCVSIPKETVILSQTLGNDLSELRSAHIQMIEIHYSKVKDEINSFIDDVYTPFIIHYVLNLELKKHKEGQSSIYGTLEVAGSIADKKESREVLKEMSDFLRAAHHQIKLKRKELLEPIILQENQILKAVNQSYSNAIDANTTLTAYLQSIKKVKGAQKEVLSKIGLEGADEILTESIIKLSEGVNKAVSQGKKIDIESDNAFQKVNEVSEKIKKIINKKNN
ncbi:hypothetical protein EMN47_12270 [Prolixibacteraceae bacterium JC049]|nr:hypothetical protein [Prolixibacteraceae bacterium JC049]